MAYTGFHVFGDSLVDSGNALKLAQFYGTLTFSDLPDGAPTAQNGYFQGRFTNGYTFADLLANKAIGTVTKPVFPYGYEDPWLDIPIAPWASDPSGTNLNFAYGGAQIRRGSEVVSDLDAQTDAFRDAIDGEADPGALYAITIGGNDIRSLVPTTGNPVARAEARAVLDSRAQILLHELSQLVTDDGVEHILITGMPDVGLVARYDRDNNNLLGPDEAVRSAAATEYSHYLDVLIRTVVVPGLELLGATVTYVPIMDHVDGDTGANVIGALGENLETIAYLNGIRPDEAGETAGEEFLQNLLAYDNFLFFDGLHPTAQAHALLASRMQAGLGGGTWTEVMPLLGADVDYAAKATIGAAGEVDRTVVAMVAGTSYTFQALGVSALTPYVLGQLELGPVTGTILADPQLRLRSAGGTLVQSDDDSGAGLDATLTFTAASSGTYTLEAVAVGGLTGNYVLTATVSGAAMDAGNIYTVSSASTLVLEGAGGFGDDILRSSVSYALAAGSEIEVLRTTNDRGKSALNLTGNEFDQTIIGNAAANIIEGKGGADTLTGLGGSDRFVLGGAPDAASVDRITDYGRGDIVDVSQVLNVAGGVNAVGAGYLRVTTGGLIQVDLSGDANDWVTLATVNGSGAVSVRYLSGGTAMTVSVNRVADGAASALAKDAVADYSLDSRHGIKLDALGGQFDADFWL